MPAGQLHCGRPPWQHAIDCPPLATLQTPRRALAPVAGYDEASSYQTDVTTTNTLADGQAVRSLSGEFCQADGSFTLQRPEGNAAPLSGSPCTVLNKLVCVRYGGGGARG